MQEREQTFQGAEVGERREPGCQGEKRRVSGCLRWGPGERAEHRGDCQAVAARVSWVLSLHVETHPPDPEPGAKLDSVPVPVPREAGAGGVRHARGLQGRTPRGGPGRAFRPQCGPHRERKRKEGAWVGSAAAAGRRGGRQPGRREPRREGDPVQHPDMGQTGLRAGPACSTRAAGRAAAVLSWREFRSECPHGHHHPESTERPQRGQVLEAKACCRRHG